MRRVSIIVLLLTPMFLLAQQQTGKVSYTQKVNLHMGLGEGNEEMKAMLPEFQESKFELFFNDKATLYRSVKKEVTEVNETTEDGGQMVIRMEHPKSTIFTDLATGNQIEERDMMGKQYLISGASEFKWKMTGESKEIAGHQCMKAVLEGKDNTIEAWFTSTLPIPSGPSTFGQLPGLILEVVMDEGRMIMSAETVEIQEIDAALLVAPTKGKKITRKKYQKLQEERMREMNAQGGGGVRMIIRTEEN
ncbi:MAG: GLPGLI family protein [Saprospiraceae bacterium]|nr:GLPGLI family protein [Saprospiraceae bacterium]